MSLADSMQAAAALVPVARELRGRRGPAGPHSLFYTRTEDGESLHCTLLPGPRPSRSAVILAHPAVVGSYHPQVLALAGELALSWPVVLFDFRGHARSSGRYHVGFADAAADLEAVVERVRVMGFEQIAAAGFSLGAAAVLLVSSRRDCFDAVVSIGCPPRFPEVPFYDSHPLVARTGLRALGMRVSSVASPAREPTPLDVAAGLPAVPKLLVFGEWEVVPAVEIERFAAAVAPPREVMTVPSVWHADLAGREPLVREWLERHWS